MGERGAVGILVKERMFADPAGSRRTVMEFRDHGWRICEGSRCADCEPLPLSGDRIWALTWLRRFRSNGAAMQQFRGLLACFDFSGRRLTDGEVLERLSWLFQSGRLHACPVEWEPVPAGEAAGAAPPPFPLSERKPAPPKHEDTRDPDTFPADADLVAAAALLTEAAAGGAPACPL